jgi:hypothetical protein
MTTRGNRAAAARLAPAAAALVALLCAAPQSPAGARQGAAPQAAARPAAVVFAVESSGGETTIDPVLGVGAGGRVVPAAGESEDAEEGLKTFADVYFKPGRKYRLIFGGGEAGALTVKGAKTGDECFRTGAHVEAQTAARLGRNVMALATDSETLGRRQPSRRAPTEEERAGVEKLARTLLAQRRVTAAQLRSLQTVNLTATDFDGDGAAELVGTFKVARGKGASEQLFLLAEPQAGGAFRAGLANRRSLKAADLPSPEAFDSAGPGGFLSEILIDQLDLDGDGAGELFTYGRSFEGAQYTVYKKTRGRWQKLEEFYVYRCAY